MVKKDPLFEEGFNCKTTDLVGGFPASTAYELGSKMYAYDPATKEVSMIFKLVDIGDGKTWMRLGEI